jgi:linoleoyl-CoA desaturase
MSNSNVRFIDPDKDKTLFFATLRKRVDGYFKQNNISRHYNSAMVIKTIVLLSAYLLPFIFILFFSPGIGVSLLLWTLMGFAMAGIGMSVMHDANHGSYSGSHKLNSWLGYISLNLLGGSVFNWKIQHNLLHHTYTNITHIDDDIDDKLILRFSPHTPVKWYHKLQFIYAFAFYGIVTIYWFILKDFLQFGRYVKEGHAQRQTSNNTMAIFRIIASKLIYFALFLVVPIVLFKVPAANVISGFILMHVIGGIVLTVIFQLAHTVEGTTHPLPNEENVIENNWAIHQLNTTVNFSRKNKFLSWYLGGLNYQVEHHLFPNICHVHYPAISEIVESTCKEFNVPYLCTESFYDAFMSHVRTLKRFGKLPDINEAIA